METISHNHKRRSGFIKGKLASSFSRVAKAKPFSAAQYVSTVKSEDYSGADLLSKHNLNRSSFTPVQKGPSTGPWAAPADYGQKRSYYYYGFGVENGDENVDLKATSYITNVRERFKLERFDMDQGNNNNNKIQEIH